jgi:hypothetical protein
LEDIVLIEDFQITLELCFEAGSKIVSLLTQKLWICEDREGKWHSEFLKILLRNWRQGDPSSRPPPVEDSYTLSQKQKQKEG